jgi:hypothetical protein
MRGNATHLSRETSTCFGMYYGHFRVARFLNDLTLLDGTEAFLPLKFPINTRVNAVGLVGAGIDLRWISPMKRSF